MIELNKRGGALLGGDYGSVWNRSHQRLEEHFVNLFGYTPLQAITAATKFGGELMKMDAGLVKKLLLVNGDPSMDGQAQDKRNLTAIMKDGTFHSPRCRGAVAGSRREGRSSESRLQELGENSYQGSAPSPMRTASPASKQVLGASVSWAPVTSRSPGLWRRRGRSSGGRRARCSPERSTGTDWRAGRRRCSPRRGTPPGCVSPARSARSRGRARSGRGLRPAWAHSS